MHPSLQHHGSSSTMFSIRADRTRRAYSRCGKQCATKACVEVSPRISPCERSTDVAVSATSAIHVGGRATNAWVTEVRNATAPALRKTETTQVPLKLFAIRLLTSATKPPLMSRTAQTSSASSTLARYWGRVFLRTQRDYGQAQRLCDAGVSA
jgi:hypothetical protein